MGVAKSIHICPRIPQMACGKHATQYFFFPPSLPKSQEGNGRDEGHLGRPIPGKYRSLRGRGFHAGSHYPSVFTAPCPTRSLIFEGVFPKPPPFLINKMRGWSRTRSGYTTKSQGLSGQAPATRTEIDTVKPHSYRHKASFFFFFTSVNVLRLIEQRFEV